MSERVSAYTAFLQSPNTAHLANDASINYITTTTTIEDVVEAVASGIQTADNAVEDDLTRLQVRPTLATPLLIRSWSTLTKPPVRQRSRLQPIPSHPLRP